MSVSAASSATRIGCQYGATTTAVPVDGTDGAGPAGYRINGRKQWISNGSIADACTVLAMAPGGPSWFIVERGTDGLSSAPPEDKHGIRLSNTAALFLDDVVVPAANLVGGVEGRGLVQAQQVFGYTRLMVAAFGLGGGWEAMDRAIRYSTQRIQGGAPLSEKQGYTHKLIVPMAARLLGAGHELTVGGPWSEGRISACTRETTAEGKLVLRAGANARGMQGYAVGR